MNADSEEDDVMAAVLSGKENGTMISCLFCNDIKSVVLSMIFYCCFCME